MNKYAEVLRNYQSLNKGAKEKATVFFGADWLNKIPVTELAQDYGIESVYNRSLNGLTLDDAELVLETCVFDLQPDKVFINLGENEPDGLSFDAVEFEEKFEWLLYTIHSKCNCRIYILSVVDNRSRIVNELLKQISEKYECEYIDISNCRTSILNFFTKIRFFLRSKPINFCEAFGL